MNTFPIPVRYLKALLRITPKANPHDCMNGILLDIAPDSVRLVTTDGHRLAIFNCPRDDQTSAHNPAQILMPRDVVVNAIRGLKKSVSDVQFTDPVAKDSKPALGNSVFTPNDGKFPDYSRFLSEKKPSGERAAFDAYYLADFRTMIEDLLGTDRVVLPMVFENGNAAAPVTFPDCPEFYAVIMPIRTGPLPEWKLPGWLSPEVSAMQDRASKPDDVSDLC